MFSDSQFLADLVCFYLNNNNKLILSGSNANSLVTGKIFKIVHFNIVIIVSSNTNYLNRIMALIKGRENIKKTILITGLAVNKINKLFYQPKLFDLILPVHNLEHLDKSIFTPARQQQHKDITPQAMNPAFTTITKREKEILLLIFNGKKTKEIADTLFLSAKTIENHRNNILKKTRSKSMIHLMNSLCKIGFFNKSEINKSGIV